MAKQQVVNSLIEKVGRVIEENTRLQASAAQAIGERDKLRSENRELKARIDRLEARIKLLELGEGFTGGANTEESRKRARAQINRLMREIDRCIALMNQ